VARAQVFTVGHSNHAIGVFLGLLAQHGIEAVVDTRSFPRSKFAPQYDAAALRESLREREIDYIFLGKELGGRPAGADFYDTDGRVWYSKVAAADFFRRGLERLDEVRKQRRVALLCSEEDPSVCHRRLLITRVLHERGIAVAHIRGSGAVETEEQILAAEAAQAASNPQMALFEHSEIPEWKSIPSVLPKNRPSDSSAS
jgi:uncharacterized protein (DUF488 family)